MTYDQAMDAFSHEQTMATASRLLRTGRTYWLDGMIEDSTFAVEVLEPLMRFLADASGDCPNCDSSKTETISGGVVHTQAGDIYLDSMMRCERCGLIWK